MVRYTRLIADAFACLLATYFFFPTFLQILCHKLSFLLLGRNNSVIKMDTPDASTSSSSSSSPSSSSRFSPYRSNTSTGDRQILPFYSPIRAPIPPETEVPVIPSLMAEACGSKIITGGVMGSVIGVAMGIFMGAMGDVSPIQIINGREVPQAPLREQMRAAFKATAGKAGGWARSFGILTALFGGVECVIEKYRAKHDVWNPAISGCIVGATLAAKGGPAPACFGCVGFGGFSLVVDKILGPH